MYRVTIFYDNTMYMFESRDLDEVFRVIGNELSIGSGVKRVEIEVI